VQRIPKPPRSPLPPVSGTPTVAVVIPCFNDAHYLGDAIESVRGQTRAADEIVVVDDGSTDDSASIAKGAPGVRYLRQRNAGTSAARNAGLVAVRSEFVQFLDADDVLLPTALEAGLRCASARPTCAFVAGRHLVVRAEGPHERPWPELASGDLYAELLRLNFVACLDAVLFRRVPLLESGAFDTSLRACEDYDVLLRLARLHPAALHDDVVAEYRLRADSLSGDTRRMYDSIMTVLARQRPYVQDDPERAEALRAGWRFYYHYFGRPMLDRAVDRLRRREAILDPLRAFASVAEHDRGALKWYLRDKLAPTSEPPG
jgi:glycosyltransferase involved in cell wall biosynthesis